MSKVLTVSTSEFMNQTETPKRKQNISVLKQNCWQLILAQTLVQYAAFGLKL